MLRRIDFISGDSVLRHVVFSFQHFLYSVQERLIERPALGVGDRGWGRPVKAGGWWRRRLRRLFPGTKPTGRAAREAWRDCSARQAGRCYTFWRNALRISGFLQKIQGTSPIPFYSQVSESSSDKKSFSPTDKEARAWTSKAMSFSVHWATRSP